MTDRAPGSRRPRVLVNIPILNEIELIARLLDRVTAALAGYDFVVLIVDDGSTDGTLEYVHTAAAANPGRIAVLSRKKMRSGCQRGAALLAGLKWALTHGDFEVFVEMDGDFSHVPEDLPRGIDAILEERGDVVVASKYIDGSITTGRTAGRTLISIICNIAVRAVIDRHLRDFSNGYRFYNRKAAELIPQFEIRYGSPIYLTEAMAIWLKHGMRVVEIPGHYVGRHEGLSKVRVNDYVKAAIGVFETGVRYHITGFTRMTQTLAIPEIAPAAPAPDPAVPASTSVMDSVARGREFWNATPCDGQPTYASRADFRYRKDAWILPILEKIAAAGHRNILEVGCGQGTDGVTLCRLLPPGTTYIGVDMSDVSLMRAREAADQVGEQLQTKPIFQVEDAERLSFRDGSFDCVLSVGVLHHSTSTERALAEVQRVLTPDGVAYVLLYRTWAPKLIAALTLRRIQGGLDAVLGTERILYRASRRLRIGEHTVGTAVVECFGVPILRSYTREGMKALFRGFRSTELTAHGSGLPGLGRVQSLNRRLDSRLGYLWLAEARK